MKDSFDINNPPHLIDKTFYSTSSDVWFMNNKIATDVMSHYHALLNEINFQYENDRE